MTIPKYFYFRVHAKKYSVEIEDASNVDVEEIVYCKDCRKHNTDSGHVSDICPLTFIRGKAHGHEFDYQYCVYGERKEEQG